MNKFKGLFAALVTPYTEEKQVDYKQVKRLVRHLLDSGMDGFYVCGSTAEAFLLSMEERKGILEAVTEENNGQGTVIAHVGNIGVGLSAELARHAEKSGADAVSSISPFYYQFSQDEICAYYDELAGSTGLPMFIYNFPANSGFKLTNELLLKMLENPRIVGVKHTSSDFFQLERFKRLNRDLVVWNGYDEMLLCGLVAGADGGIGSTYNCMPGLYRGLLEAYQGKDLELASDYQRRVNNVIECMVGFGVFQSVKALLDYNGIRCNGCRSPFKALAGEEVEKLLEVYRANIQD